MSIPLAVGIVVALAMLVVGVIGYLMDRSAERHERNDAAEHSESRLSR